LTRCGHQENRVTERMSSGRPCKATQCSAWAYSKSWMLAKWQLAARYWWAATDARPAVIRASTAARRASGGGRARAGVACCALEQGNKALRVRLMAHFEHALWDLREMRCSRQQFRHPQTQRTPAQDGIAHPHTAQTAAPTPATILQP